MNQQIVKTVWPLKPPNYVDFKLRPMVFNCVSGE